MATGRSVHLWPFVLTVLLVAGCDGAPVTFGTPAGAETPVSSVDKHERRVSHARDAARSIGEGIGDWAKHHARNHFRGGMAEALGLDTPPTPSLSELRRAAYETGQYYGALRVDRRTGGYGNRWWRDVLRGLHASEAERRLADGEPICTAPVSSTACRCHRRARSFEAGSGIHVHACSEWPGDVFLLAVDYGDLRALFPIGFKRITGGSVAGAVRPVSATVDALIGEEPSELRIQGYFRDEVFSPNCAPDGRCWSNFEHTIRGAEWVLTRPPEPRIQVALVDRLYGGALSDDTLECFVQSSAKACGVETSNPESVRREIDFRPEQRAVIVDGERYATAGEPLLFPGDSRPPLLQPVGTRLSCALGPWDWAGLTDNHPTSTIHEEFRSVSGSRPIKECFDPLDAGTRIYLEIHATEEGIDPAASGVAERSRHLLEELTDEEVDELDACLDKVIGYRDEWRPDPDRDPEPPFSVLHPECS